MSVRNRLIKELASEDHDLYTAYRDGVRELASVKHFVHNSGRYPLTSYGRLNSAPLFAELYRNIVSASGRAGLVVPTGIATDSFNQYFFGDLINTETLASLYDFENRRNIFPGVGHGRFKFCMLTMTGKARRTEAADFAFFALDVADLKDPERRFPLSTEDIRLLNPNTQTCPIFRTRRDAELTKSIYRRIPVLINENTHEGDPWGLKVLLMFMMNTDSHLFRTREEMDDCQLEGNIYGQDGERHLPLYEAKMIHQYDHRYGDYALKPENSQDTELPPVPDQMLQNARYAVMPRYWVPDTDVEGRLASRWSREWLLGFRSIGRSTDVRTVISTILPRFAVSGKLPVVSVDLDKIDGIPHLIANLNSFVLDFCARQKVGGTDLALHYVKQFPILAYDSYYQSAPWRTPETLRYWLTSRVLELTYTAWDLKPFSRDFGYDGPPFRWDLERRFMLRCELDAAFFHLYGIERDDVDYIMETFPIVKRKDEATHGEYRTKRVILEIYDEMARAAETGQPYQTLLDPPPVELDISSGESATASLPPQRPPEKRPYLQPEELQPASIAAEEKALYNEGINKAAKNFAPEEPRNVADTTPEREDSSHLQSEHSGDADDPASYGDIEIETSPEETLFPENEVETRNTIPSIEEAALALHACVPDGEKVQREKLLLDSARELGHTKLTRKVRRALNKSLNTEHNAGRLKTDWQLVWKPRKR